MTKLIIISWFLTIKMLLEKLSTYAVMLIMYEKNAFEIRSLFSELCFFQFFSSIFMPTDLTRSIQIKWTASQKTSDKHLSNHVWHYMGARNSFGELLPWTQSNKICFPQFLLKLGAFLDSIIIFTSIWSMLPMHVIHGWKAVYVSKILAPRC